MVEQVEKVAQRAVLVPQPVNHEFGVMSRQCPGWAGQPHERHRHGKPAVRLLDDAVNLTGGKQQGLVGSKTNDFVFRIRVGADRMLKQAFQNPHCLKELKPVGLGAQDGVERWTGTPGIVGGGRFAHLRNVIRLFCPLSGTASV